MDLRSQLDFYKNALYTYQKDKLVLKLMNDFNYPEINNNDANKFSNPANLRRSHK